MSHISSVVRPVIQGSATESVTPRSIPLKNIRPFIMMHCEVVFGSPSMNCNGTGICKITSTNSIQSLHERKECRITFGQVAAAPDGKVSLFFFRELLCIQLYRKHFHKGILKMEEACPIPSEISNRLNLKGKSILPGKYAVLECDGYFRVDVNCE